MFQRLVDTDATAEDLAGVLTNTDRTDPVVVISASEEPVWLDPQAVQTQLKTTVYLLMGRDVGWALSDALPDEAGVFGDCVRVYPGGLDWLEKPWLASYLTRAHAEKLGRVKTMSTLDDYLARSEVLTHVQPEPSTLSSTLAGAVDPSVLHRFKTEAIAASAAAQQEREREERERRQREAAKALAEAMEQSELERLKERVSVLEAELHDSVPAEEHQEWVERVFTAESNELHATERMQREAMKVTAMAAELKQLRALAAGHPTGGSAGGQAGAAAHSAAAGGTASSPAVTAGSPSDPAGPNGHDSSAELDSLAERARRAQHEVARLRDKERRNREEIRNLRRSLEAIMADATGTDDPGARLRERIHQQWERRIPDADKPQRPMLGYRFAPDFMDSVDATEGLDPDKLASVMMEVLVGLDSQLAGRQLHQYRVGEGGEDERVSHPFYGTLWRVSLQVKTASARRLHFYRSKDGIITFASVRVHDAAA